MGHPFLRYGQKSVFWKIPKGKIRFFGLKKFFWDFDFYDKKTTLGTKDSSLRVLFKSSHIK